MKNALKMTLTYFMFLLIGNLFGIIIIVEFLATVGLIAGRTQTLLTGDIFMRAFFIVAPLIIVFSGTYLALYAVRHHAKKLVAAVTYMIICLFTWAVVFPAFLTFAKANPFLSQIESVEKLAELNDAPLTKNYFRKTGKFIYYSTFENSADNSTTMINPATGLVEKKTDAVVIHMDGTSPESMMHEVSSVSDILKEQAKPFTDTLIRDTMSYEFLPEFYRGFDLLMQNATKAWDTSILSWVFFALFGVALCSVYAFIGISHWRIINTLTVIVMSAFIVIYNFLYFTGFFSFINISWNGIFSQIENPLLVIANFGVAFIFTLIGLIVSIVRSAKERRR